MKLCEMMVAVAVAFVLAGCQMAGGVQKISSLTLPKPKAIEGKITRFYSEGFILRDASGAIYVELEEANLGMLRLGERVKVYGNLDEDAIHEFEAYKVVKADGGKIEIIRPKLVTSANDNYERDIENRDDGLPEAGL